MKEKEVAGYVLVTRITNGWKKEIYLEPAVGFPEELAIVGQSISQEQSRPRHGWQIRSGSRTNVIPARNVAAATNECTSASIVSAKGQS